MGRSKQTQGDDWQARFQRRSEESCAEHLEGASKAELGKAAATRATRLLARLAPLALWKGGDGAEFCGWNSQIEFRWSQGVAHLGARFGVPETDERALRAWSLWRSGEREAGADLLAGIVEMGALPMMTERALEGSESQRDELCGALGPSALERALSEALRRAAPKERDPKAYPALAREFFLTRLRQLQSQGLLPAASFVSVEWRRPSAGAMYAGSDDERPEWRQALRCSLEWRPEPGQEPEPSSAPGGGAGPWPSALAPLLGVLGHSGWASNSAPRRSLASEVSFVPGVGWGAIFPIGGIVHGWWIRSFGARRALEADWGRFEEVLAQAHAILLAQVREHGGLDGLARADKVELAMGLRAFDTGSPAAAPAKALRI